MLDTVIPDLRLHGLSLGPNQVPLDLSWFLYEGAATLHHRRLKKAVECGQLGRPKRERLPLLEAIHEKWQSDIASKAAADGTVRERWERLRSLVRFAERANRPITIAGALSLYLAFCKHLASRADINDGNRYAYALVIAQIIAPVLSMDGRKLIWKTKIRHPKRLGNQAAKENLYSTATFIQTLIETVRQLPISVIRGPLPVTLRYDNGAEHTIHLGLALKPVDQLRVRDSFKHKRALAARERRANDTSNRARSQLINLRIDSEMLIFINQTGSNLSQALQLTGSQFRYQTAGSYLRLFAWKNRAKHDVELRVPRGYRRHFEAYLNWRSALFPEDPDGLTFPFVWSDGERAMERTRWAFPESRKLMRTLGQPFVHSQQLRKTIGNFFRRNVSRQAAAELLSNTEKTFRKSYEEVHHQRSARELVSFWSDVETLMSAVGPGGCQEMKPRQRDDAPEGSPMPDCDSGGACLFCDKNRDLRSFDHAWNLATFHHLKLAEYNSDRTPHSLKKNHPVALTVERAAAKIEAMFELGRECAEWVTEARLRVQEGRYHPYYAGAFTILDRTQ